MQKLIGMIGGVSWESTVLYYQLINQAVKRKWGGLNSARILIFSLNYHPIVEWERQDQWEAVSGVLVEAAQKLENAGCELLVLGCNTLHKVSGAIEAAIHIPFIHIADAVGEALTQTGIKKVGLLGTQFTMEDDFYKGRLQSQFNLDVIVPPVSERQAIDKIIYQELCLGKVSAASRSFLLKCVDSLANSGAQGIILGCTEFGMLVKNGDASLPLLDSTMLHVNKIVEQST